MKENIFIISDTHFGHFNVLKLANRPFKDIWIHDETLISNWNSVVGENDIVYHLGDFAYKCSVDYIISIMERLNGRIYLLEGNHDTRTLKANNRIHRFVSVRERMEIMVPGSKLPVTLQHYPMISWNHSGRGAISLFGHLHERKLDNITSNQLNMSVENWNYTPVSMETIIETIQKQNEK